MDHFIGFDHLLRLFLARDTTIDLYGPPGIIENVIGKLHGYTWNLVDGYPFVLTVHEVARDEMRAVRFPATSAFTPEQLPPVPFSGTVFEASGFRVNAVHLDHRIECLAYALEEDIHLNVRTDELERLGVPAGAWLNALKAAVRRGEPDDAMIAAEWRADGEVRRQAFRLGDLQGRLLVQTPGQKLVYVTDVLFSAANVERVVAFARGADVFYCESLVVDADRDQALKRYHLTARQAGTLARRAGARRLETFHFSPRYDGDADLLQTEAAAAFSGALEPDEPV
jgi:ribonuclease Z